MRRGVALFLCSLALGTACGGSPSKSSGAGGDDGAAGGPPGDAAAGASEAAAGGAAGAKDATDGAPPGTSCEAPGRFGAPQSTFTLPVKTGAAIDYADVQKSLPNVDWNTLERLYIPAGAYPQLMLGNLPTRDPAHPLVITNLGGQVRIGPSKGANYIWSMGGGAGWVLTGRYDADSKTGDAAFPGHRCGVYAHSAGTYGIVSDDAFDFTAPYLHMGIAVQGATDFEIEFVEVERSGFAGIRLINPRAAGDPATPMKNVSVHDVYVHDTGGEGFYFGWTGTPPSNLFPGLQIFNCRLLRTGNEALQIQDLGDGSHVHHNVFASGGLRWLDNGLGRYQDNTTQVLSRSGHIEIDHNVFVDGAGSWLNSFYAPEPGDAPMQVTYHDNYFADTLSLGVWVGGSAAAGSTVTFESNALRGLVWGYDVIAPDPGATATVFGVDGAFVGALALNTNRWEGARALVSGITGGDGSKGPITASGNVNGAVPELAFRDAGWPLAAGHHLTSWAPKATVAAGSPAVTFHAGDVVTYGDAPDLYRCTADTSAGPPAEHAESWVKLPAPVDDVRVAGSDYAGYGVP
jgi:hypothetical protein